MTNQLKHAAYLLIASLMERHFKPGILGAPETLDLAGRKPLLIDEGATAKPLQCRDCVPCGANAKPPTATSPDPGGPSHGSASDAAVSLRHFSLSTANRSGPAASIARALPSAASAQPSR